MSTREYAVEDVMQVAQRRIERTLGRFGVWDADITGKLRSDGGMDFNVRAGFVPDYAPGNGKIVLADREIPVNIRYLSSDSGR